MVIDRFIIPSLPQHSRSITDLYLEAEQEELLKFTLTSKSANQTKHIKDLAKANVDALYKQEQQQNPDEQIGMAEETLPYDVDPSVFFILNYGKYNIIFRNYLVAKFATKRINRTAGIVMKTFFRHGRDKMYSVKEDFSPAATPLLIANMLDPEVFTKGDIILKHDNSYLCYKKNDDKQERQKPIVTEVIEGYFRLLQADQAGFLKHRDELGANQYSVNFKKLRHFMRRLIFENFLTESFGIAYCRIVRILLDKGRLDEAQIQKFAMLPLKDVRHKLGFLMERSIVEIQEVPRSSDHSTSRSFHLWYVSLDKCFEELLQNVYRTIGNLQQRKEEELARRRRLIDKLSREDVIENMDLLNKIDQAEVAKMDSVVEKIEVSKSRLDDIIMIMRDF
ncbi:MAG: hypothetical protein EXX96DRAFT_476829 [Benjaminiella poitrasii]|nr:MAG: hypothetical protein EXX96DRAFT_476829 [Benjaminiella poitrasii]